MTLKPTYEELEQRIRDQEKAEIDRERVEKELRISKQLLRDVMDIVPAYLCAKDMDGRFLLVNRKLTDFYGTTVEEMTGMLHSDVCEDEDELRSMLADDWEVVERGKPKLIPEETMERPDGSIAILKTYKIPFMAREDPAVLIVSSDITEQKRAEAERKKLEEQFQQAQKLESVGRLAGGVAHDLNNLLSPVLGYGEMLLEDLNGDEQRKALVMHIVQAAERAKDIVHQLLAFSRKQTLEFRTIDLNMVLNRFEKLLRRTIREDIHIEIIADSRRPYVKGDVGQLEQVIMNLAVNAQDAMPDGGVLTFETSLVETDESHVACHKDIDPGQYAVLRVSDTGHGIDAETSEHIFEPFYSTKGEQGTGLGLSTVYGIVKQHGGYIRVNSKAGKGTTFRICMPASKEPESEIKFETIETSDLKGSETILLVEDNDGVRALTHMLLNRKGYSVLVAENGQKALDIIDQHEGPVHLLLTDVVMPGMNGKELFNRISDRHPEIKVLYMSGYTNDVIACRGVLNEDECFIPKPFSLEGIARKIREALEIHGPGP